MSKTVKNFMMRDYVERMGEDPSVVVLDVSAIGSNETNELRAELLKSNIRVTRIRNKLFAKAFEGKGASALAPHLTGPNTVAYGAESVVDVARRFVEIIKTNNKIELKAAVLDGVVFLGEDGVKALSKYPTRDEAIATAVTLVLSPGRKLLGAVKGPGGRLLGIVKSIEEKLEKGETIARLG